MFGFIIDNIFTMITAIITIIALFQTRQQIKISNKQFLFKERIEKFVLVKQLIGLYEDNKEILDYSETVVDRLQF